MQKWLIRTFNLRIYVVRASHQYLYDRTPFSSLPLYALKTSGKQILERRPAVAILATRYGRLVKTQACYEVTVEVRLLRAHSDGSIILGCVHFVEGSGAVKQILAARSIPCWRSKMLPWIDGKKPSFYQPH